MYSFLFKNYFCISDITQTLSDWALKSSGCIKKTEKLTNLKYEYTREYNLHDKNSGEHFSFEIAVSLLLNNISNFTK